MTAVERDDLIKSREAAEILHRDIRTVHRWAEDGRLPVAVRVPGYRGGYLFHRSEIEEVRMEQSLDTPTVNVDAETLKYLGYDPGNIATRALVLLAQRYELDPLLGEIQLIKTGQGVRLYVSRDGMLQVAHRSGFLDGMDVEQRRNSTNDGWTAYVSVWRKDMSHAFRYGAQCKDSEPAAKAGNGPEMALARAERRALRRAFQIRSDFYPERPNQEFDDLDVDVAADVDVGTVAAATAAAVDTGVRSPGRHQAMVRPGDWTPSTPDQAEARTALANWPVKRRLEFLGRHRIEHFDEDWPAEAVAEILAGPPEVRDTAPEDGPAGDEP